MGTSLSIFISRRKRADSYESPTSVSSSHKKSLKSQIVNRKISYLDMINKYQLSNQRWTTIRQYEKLEPMVLKNFAKVLERGKKMNKTNSEIKTTTIIIEKDYLLETNNNPSNKSEFYEQNSNINAIDNENGKQKSDIFDNSKNLLLENTLLNYDNEYNQLPNFVENKDFETNFIEKNFLE